MKAAYDALDQTAPIVSRLQGLEAAGASVPVYISMAQAFGPSRHRSRSEVYTALQAGVAQALEGSPSTLYTGKFYEVAKNLARTDHIYNASTLGSHLPPSIPSLPISRQPSSSGKEATSYNLDLVKKSFETDLGRLKQAGSARRSGPGALPGGCRGEQQEIRGGPGGTALELFLAVDKMTKG